MCDIVQEHAGDGLRYFVRAIPEPVAAFREYMLEPGVEFVSLEEPGERHDNLFGGVCGDTY